MPSGLSPDVALGVHLSAIMSRHCYTVDPEPVLDELRTVAGSRDDVLAHEAGLWAGFHDHEHTAPLAAALRGLPGADVWVPLGVRRRGIQNHRINPPHAPDSFNR